MKIFTFRQEQYMPIPVSEAWDFFSLATNLERITPPDVKFTTITDLTGKRLHNGMLIKYKLRPLLNVPLSWETEIREVQPPHRFTDKQLKGPYAFWEHTHVFTEAPGGTKMTDEVRYAMPLGWLGVLMHTLVVKQQLMGIFKYRDDALVKIFGVYKQSR